MTALVTHAYAGLALLVAKDPPPADKDVKAGWTAFAVFILLIAAVVFLCFSFVKQIRKTRAAQAAGVFGHDEGETSDDQSDTPATH